MRGFAVLAFLLLWLLIVAGATYARPPEGIVNDPDVAEWFRSLRQPVTQIGCCAASDCERVDARQTSDGWEVYVDLINGRGGPDRKWEPVPPNLILQAKDNPTGSAVACIVGQKLFCFVRAPDI